MTRWRANAFARRARIASSNAAEACGVVCSSIAAGLSDHSKSSLPRSISRRFNRAHSFRRLAAIGRSKFAPAPQ
ncbi:MAG: hypothetical protein WB647_09005, partial [Roseiarcus sp.]|uniref:hypothetical protein n=1 Tax=Roseiarcus sp. TaxID=1969460 RepID=UPI003C3C3F18